MDTSTDSFPYSIDEKTSRAAQEIQNHHLHNNFSVAALSRRQLLQIDLEELSKNPQENTFLMRLLRTLGNKTVKYVQTL